MDNCTLQNYLRSLCKAFCIAHEDCKEQRTKMGSNEEMREEYNTIVLSKGYMLRAIEDVVNLMSKKGYKMTVTSHEELVTLTVFYYTSEERLSKYRIVDIDESKEEDFPADSDLYEKFFDAYCTKSNSTMRDAYRLI